VIAARVAAWWHPAGPKLPEAVMKPVTTTSVTTQSVMTRSVTTKSVTMISVAVMAVLATPTPAPAGTDEGAFFGLLRARDLSPFGFLRLDMRPAHAVTIAPGTWVIETELGYQNTWALSPEVEKYLVGLEAAGRRRAGADLVQAIGALPGENYLLDLEAATLDVTLHYKLSPHWSAYAIVSAVSYFDGFLDHTIERFHDAFGFSSFGRPALERNGTALVFDLKGAQVAALDRPTDGGLTDPTFGVRYSGARLAGPWHLSLEAAVKLPVAGRRMLLSTGRADYGVQATLQRAGRRHAVYVDAAAVYYAGAIEPVPHDAQVVPTLILGYEYRLTARTNVNLQAYASESVYSRRQTNLDELLAMKYQYSFGVRHHRENWLLSFGLTENVQNVNNTPDVGFQLGVAWIPHRR
jgi:hypothetical protein